MPASSLSTNAPGNTSFLYAEGDLKDIFHETWKAFSKKFPEVVEDVWEVIAYTHASALDKFQASTLFTNQRAGNKLSYDRTWVDAFWHLFAQERRNLLKLAATFS